MKYTKLITISGQLDTLSENMGKRYIYESLRKACKKLKIEYFEFDAYKVTYEKNETMYEIKDSEDNICQLPINECPTTIIYNRYVKDQKTAQDLIVSLEADKCLIINPFSAIHISMDKFLLAETLTEAEIPQPKYQLLSDEDIDEDDVKKKVFNEKLDQIYPGNKSEDVEYVVKVLDGYDSKGVFLCTRKNILSIMQALFKINEDVNRKLPNKSKKTPLRKYIIQEKLDSNTGDIKVHCITVGDRQKIIFASQADKNKNDFRSNVSENSSTLIEKELSDEQKELVYKTAKASGLIWSTVDLMETKEGSKVIEFNATPGDMYWISKAMNDQNIFEIVLNFINGED